MAARARQNAKERNGSSATRHIEDSKPPVLSPNRDSSANAVDSTAVALARASGAAASGADGTAREDTNSSAVEGSTVADAAEKREPPVMGAGDGSFKSHLFVFTNAKAGMGSVDKEKVNRVVYEMSKDSKYFKNAERHDKRVSEKVAVMLKRAEAARKESSMSLDTSFGVSSAQDERVAALEAHRQMDRLWVVCDLDQFFAAVEIRDNPRLRDKPVAVGGMSMISTANYVARKYGVRAAMPGFIAVKLCPDLVFVSGGDYKGASREVQEVFKEYDPQMRCMSLDEAYLDLTDCWLNRWASGWVDRVLSEGSAKDACAGDASGAGAAAAENVLGSAAARAPLARTDGVGLVDDHGQGVDLIDNEDEHEFEVKGFAFSQEVEDDILRSQPTGSEAAGGAGAGASASPRERPDNRTLGRETRIDEESDEEDEMGGLTGVDDGLPPATSRQLERQSSRSPAARHLTLRDTFGPKFEPGVKALVAEMREKIFRKTQLTASAGIACNPMLAKIGSDINKPNGQHFLAFDRHAILDFMAKLPCRKIPGIGKVMEKYLGALKIHTAGDILRERTLLAKLFTRHTSDWLLRVSLGISSQDVRVAFQANENHRKSMSTERTFGAIHEPRELAAKLRELCEKLEKDISKYGLRGRRVTLKIKGTDFKVQTRDKTVNRYVSTADEFFKELLPLLRAEMPLTLRLMGVKLSMLNGLSDGVDEKQQRLKDMLAEGAAPAAHSGAAEAPKKAEQATVPNPSSRIKASAAVPVPMQHTTIWTCERCTYRNPEVGSAIVPCCKMCMAPRPRPEGDPRAAAVPPGAKVRSSGHDIVESLRRAENERRVPEKGPPEKPAAADTAAGSGVDKAGSSAAAPVEARSATCPVCLASIRAATDDELNVEVERCLSGAKHGQSTASSSAPAAQKRRRTDDAAGRRSGKVPRGADQRERDRSSSLLKMLGR